MKKYYIGPLKEAKIKMNSVNDSTNNNEKKYSYDVDIKVIKKKNLFYRNFADVLIDDQTKFPIIMETELADLFKECISRQPDFPHSFVFADASELTRVYEKPNNNKSVKKNIVQKIKRK